MGALRSAALVAIVLGGCAAAPRPVGVRPATLLWDVGIGDKDGPSPLVETILPATWQKREVWRVVHRDLEPTTDGTKNQFDLVDVDRATLRPLRSLMERDGLHLELIFEPGKVKLDRLEGDAHTALEVKVADPMPEGPGETVHLASLPLAPGYTERFDVVDRWAASEADRVAHMELTVTGPEEIATRMGRCQVLAVTIAARGGAFRIREWVRARPPHYPVKTEYTRGAFVLVSEVREMVVDAEPACAR